MIFSYSAAEDKKRVKFFSFKRRVLCIWKKNYQNRINSEKDQAPHQPNMSCLNLTRCFGGNHPDQPATGAGGGGVAPAPSAPKAGDSIQRSKPYQDLSYEVPTGGAPGNWTECQLDETLPAEEPAATVGEGDEGR